MSDVLVRLLHRMMAPEHTAEQPVFLSFVRWLIEPEVAADLRAQSEGFDDLNECRAFRLKLRAAQKIVRAAVANNFHAPVSDVHEFDNLVESMTEFIGHDIMTILLSLENGEDGSDFWF